MRLALATCALICALTPPVRPLDVAAATATLPLPGLRADVGERLGEREAVEERSAAHDEERGLANGKHARDGHAEEQPIAADDDGLVEQPLDRGGGRLVSVVEHAETVALAAALRQRLTIWTRPDGTRDFVWHLRAAPDPDARIVALARILVSAAKRHGLDPWLLAGLAMHESGMRPEAVSRVGARSIVQLHPRGIGRRSRYVRDAAYRARCARRDDACQAEPVELGAEHLAAWARSCGSLRAGLGGYASGVCSGGGGYVARVMRERDRLLAL